MFYEYDLSPFRLCLCLTRTCAVIDALAVGLAILFIHTIRFMSAPRSTHRTLILLPLLLLTRPPKEQYHRSTTSGVIRMAAKTEVLSMEQAARMLAPNANKSLVQVAAVNIERLVQEDKEARGDLTRCGIAHLLVWHLGDMIQEENIKGASQVARALVAIAGSGPELQAEIVNANGVHMLLSAASYEASLDLNAVVAAAIGNLAVGNSTVKVLVR